MSGIPSVRKMSASVQLSSRAGATHRCQSTAYPNRTLLWMICAGSPRNSSAGAERHPPDNTRCHPVDADTFDRYETRQSPTMAASNEYDVVVLGAGPVGQNAAERARAAGLSVAMVERELVGGECSYWACVPSKALLRPVIALSEVRHVDGAREAVTGSISPDGVFGRRDRYVSDWDDTGQADWVAGIGATLVRGHGRLDGPRRVVVTAAGGEVSALTARHAVVICTGSR